MAFRPISDKKHGEPGKPKSLKLDIPNKTIAMSEKFTFASIHHLIEEINTGRFTTVNLEGEGSEFDSLPVLNKLIGALNKAGCKVQTLNMNGTLKALVEQGHDVIASLNELIKNNHGLKDISLENNMLRDSHHKIPQALKSNPMKMKIFAGNLLLKDASDVAAWEKNHHADVADDIQKRREFIGRDMVHHLEDIDPKVVAEAEEIGYPSKQAKDPVSTAKKLAK